MRIAKVFLRFPTNCGTAISAGLVFGVAIFLANRFAYAPTLPVSNNVFPSFIEQVYPAPGHNEFVYQMLCVSFDQFILNIVTGGYEGDSVQIKLDGIELPWKKDRVLGAGPRIVTEGEGRLAGSESVCLPVEFGSDQHNVFVQFTSSSNETYLYEWSFESEHVQHIDGQQGDMMLYLAYLSWREKRNSLSPQPKYN